MGQSFEPGGLDLRLRTWASRLGFGLQVWDMNFEAEIWASRLGFGFPGSGLRFKA